MLIKQGEPDELRKAKEELDRIVRALSKGLTSASESINAHLTRGDLLYPPAPSEDSQRHKRYDGARGAI